LWLGFVAALMLLSAAEVHAATPTFLITWKASGSYAPSNYSGKILPTIGSEITASVELFSNGTKVDLSGQTIYWFLDDTALGGGTGAQTMTFPPFGQPPHTMVLRVEMPGYNGSVLIHTIGIPLVQPEVAIFAPYPGGNFSSNSVTVTALPYFFNVTSPADLSYTWAVNDQSAANAENPQVAQISLPAGTPAGSTFPVTVTVQNANDSTQASVSETLTYQSSL